MRRRRDQRHAFGREPEARDLGRHLETGELAALPWLRTLRDLDLDLAAGVQILRRHAESAGGDLLYRRIGVIAVRPRMEPLRILASFAGVGAGANAIHGDVERA